jgi:hypothetical protein
MGIILYPVDSSMLGAVGYDSRAQTLLVLFNTGRAYVYYDVPLNTYLGLISAESKGRYMNQFIIGVYPYELFNGWPRSIRRMQKVRRA